MTALSVEMKGRWPGILAALGVESKYLTGKHSACPMCGGKDRWRFSDKDGTGMWICTQCGAGDGVALVMKLKNWDFKEAAKEIKRIAGGVQPQRIKAPPSSEVSRKSMNDLWRRARHLAVNDPVWRYLELRRIRINTSLLDQGELRYVEALRYHDDPPQWYPGMVARVRDHKGNPVNIHRTYLTEAGHKAPVESVRRVMAGKLPPGSAIRLFAPGPVLGVAEGIETALAASALFHVPVWAAMNAQLLEQWIPPEGVTEIRIFGDNDTNFAGQAAAYRLAHRLAMTMGVGHVRADIPKLPGDWNDALQAELIG